MGLCMGGGFALLRGKTGLFRVSAPFYGQVPLSMEGSCPVVASYGAICGPDMRLRPISIQPENLPSSSSERDENKALSESNKGQRMNPTQFFLTASHLK